MMLTESEARTKWCPQVRLFIPKPAPGYNRSAGWSGGAGTEAVESWEKETRCITTGCVHWEACGDGKGYCGLSPPLHLLVEMVVRALEGVGSRRPPR